MTTQRVQVRTPRKRKVWFNSQTSLDITSATPTIHKLFDAAQSDIGVSINPGITVMRCVGSLALVADTAGATTPAYEVVRVGLAWIDRRTRDAGSGDTAIPRPLQTGLRDTRWYQQWLLGGLEYEAPLVLGTPLEPVEDSLIRDIDVTNMQKQQTADQEFCLIAHTTALSEADTMKLRISLDFLVALP